MGKLSLRIHPLFFVFGLYFAACGKVFSFLAVTLCALLHEAGHAIAAEKRGYKLKMITLMPYGAVISGDINGISYGDEIKVVIAGPLVNLALYLATVASWWLFPETYPFTETAATANLGLFLVNLVPAYPLDGGRLLLCTLSRVLKRKTALKITKAAGIIFAAALAGLFVFSCFYSPNVSLLFFSAFALFGAFGGGADDSYIRIYESVEPSGIKKFKEVKTIAVTENATVKSLYSALDGESLYRIFVYDRRGKLKRIIEPSEVPELIKSKSVYDTLVSR
ncbi:MAG TPA: hypothetical protein DDW54_00740 [Clostridiales bacterium]|nr:hypothetical protein [Clostridiales bacterium]